MNPEALHSIQGRISAACTPARRLRDGVLLLPASKNQSPETIKVLYDLGIRDFGENRVQELLSKRESLPPDIRWHFIGHLQSNKAKYIAPFVSMVHSIQNEGLAIELSKRALESKRTIPILIEGNISGEQQKSGIAPTEAENLIEFIAVNCPNLILSGLMGMASFEKDLERTRPQFRMLRELRDRIRERHPALTDFKELSMGMSNDFTIAVEEGATIVRIGSALFGPR
ncbi:MAG TPA: YggS family pyridoxal phosphate-dependent enzyme [Candidatus Kapabacteria bacterium]